MATSERRTVAILFCDLSGFTRLSERMDPEDVRDIVDELFRRFRALIESHGGAVDKFIGDAVMAVFGAPVAHGDDPLRAVRAGLALQADLGAFNAAKSLDLGMRVGINTGEVLWGSVGGGAATVMGDPVNVAQRLESAAGVGTVLVSRAVERVARTAVRFRAAGAVALKGREESVEAFIAESEIEDVTELRAAAPSAFAGRAEEMRRLREVWSAGRGGAFVISGEAGIGKSRLAAEFRRAARTGTPSAWVATGRMREGSVQPLGPFAEILRSATPAPPGQVPSGEAVAAMVEDALRASAPDAAVLAQIVAQSAGFPVAGSAVASMDPVRFAAEAVRAWTRWLAARAPALVCVEDLHWADPSTLALLPALAAGLKDIGVLLLATSRPGVPSPDGFLTLELGSLDEAAAGRIAADVLRAPPAPELVRDLLERSGGNALYLEELVRFLEEEGLVEGTPRRLRAAGDRIPPGLGGILTARLDALQPPAKDALKSAAILGRAFWPRIVSEMTPESSLDEAESAGLASARATTSLPGEPEMAFRHTLLREAAVSLVPRKERARLHALASERLEARIPTAGRAARALAAEQREAAGQPVEAAAHRDLAAREAFQSFSWEEALQHARRAAAGAPTAERFILLAKILNKLSRAPEALAEIARAEELGGDRIRIALLRSNSQSRLGQLPEALKHVDEALALNPEGLARLTSLTRKIDLLGRLARRQEAVAIGNEAIPELERLAPGDPEAAELLADALLSLALCRFHLGEYADVNAHALRAIEIRRGSGNPAGIAMALMIYGNILMMVNRPLEARPLFEEALELDRKIGDRVGQAATLSLYARLMLEVDDLDPARRAAAESCAIYEAAGNVSGVSQAQCRLAEVELAAGRPAESIRWSQASRENARKAGSSHGEAIALLATAEALILGGDSTAARRAIEESLLHWARIRQIWNETFALVWLGIAWAESEDRGTARTALDTAAERARERRQDLFLPESLTVRAILDLDEHPAAALALLARIPERSADPWKAALLVEGLARLRMGDQTESRRLLAAARAIAPTQTFLWNKLLSRWTESLLLLRLGEAAESAALARQGLDEARGCQARRWTARFETLLLGGQVAAWPELPPA